MLGYVTLIRKTVVCKLEDASFTFTVLTPLRTGAFLAQTLMKHLDLSSTHLSLHWPHQELQHESTDQNIYAAVAVRQGCLMIKASRPKIKG